MLLCGLAGWSYLGEDNFLRINWWKSSAPPFDSLVETIAESFTSDLMTCEEADLKRIGLFCWFSLWSIHTMDH